ncbi:MAG: hypothetical protein A2498_14015 [Lentisphaerae bacterium RIFOXYC12_FULL_60_16]|nr:MAG: hypothetical protein A2498_14015 [Lentisphaerae bacterium RIFOXYC12_FULL_60_16]OGV74624.1 MAG: hypothetical protein A2269_02315 [Lentisphaerae bacterium RIFOXYA12_FULL_60_10]OGV86422.1 MAG: hypothetical protein A2340_02840 [Lentisphaerae bacterium RIFOXYB12_FULL_60_10]
MSVERVQKLIKELRSELNRLGDRDAGIKEKAGAIIVDVERQVQKLKSGHKDSGLVKRIADLVEEFEQDHPKITAIIDNISTTLSNLGI